MAMKINRRAMLALLGAGMVSACSGVRPYDDATTRNLDVVLFDKESGFWIKRAIYVDVYEGTPGSELTYLGTREVTPGDPAMGLPTGRPLVLVLAFEETSGFASYQSTSSVEIPLSPLSATERWRLDVTFTSVGTSHELVRVR